ncbi:MAG: sigma-54-dependent Fis family transcriptional regulator [Kiritimatiellae bacterium]|nr:sigma-54-dependent Fis family transcriptional regulator [Kiritimatiellia bacterium]
MAERKPVVLIVDDEKNSRDGLSRALRDNYATHTAENGHRALELLGQHAVDVLLSDVRMPGMDGLTLLQRALARSPRPVCIMLTAYGTVETAVEAMKRGAHDFLMKPVNLDELDMVIKRGLRTREIEAENRGLREKLDDKYGLENIIGQGPAMRAMFDLIRQVAPSAATVLIQGESGTGKELVARAIHHLSPRSEGPFVPVHCAALSESLLESELFGHEKGAYTGATERRRGRFELADGGTLFLDEVAEIPASVQIKLLRVLEERQFERVGGQESIDVDIRLVAATNKDLRKLKDEDRFREDLFFRLDVVTIDLPPLRERREDVPLLSYHFLKEFAEKNGKAVDEIVPEALELLGRYAWPGNVRELRNVIEKMVVLARGRKLTARDVPRHIEQDAGESPEPIVTAGLSLAEAEKQLILKTLDACGGNRSQAAQRLGISRRTLFRKLNEYAAG